MSSTLRSDNHTSEEQGRPNGGPKTEVRRQSPTEAQPSGAVVGLRQSIDPRSGEGAGFPRLAGMIRDPSGSLAPFTKHAVGENQQRLSLGWGTSADESVDEPQPGATCELLQRDTAHGHIREPTSPRLTWRANPAVVNPAA